jgi:hypothetical protein
MRKLRLREVKIAPQNTQHIRELPGLELSQAKETPPSVDVSEMRRVAKGSGIQLAN